MSETCTSRRWWWKETNEAWLWVVVVVGWAGLVLGYSENGFGWMTWFWPLGVMTLATMGSGRVAAYGTLLGSTAAYGIHLGFFWTLFGPAAVLLWLILGLWIMAFALVFRGLTRLLFPGGWMDGEGVRHREWRAVVWMLGTASLWMLLEYVRSEAYYLKFSWLNVGYAMGRHEWGLNVLSGMGVYGMGFAAALFGGGIMVWGVSRKMKMSRSRRQDSRWMSGVGAFGVVVALGLPGFSWVVTSRPQVATTVQVTGIQLEFPTETEVLRALNRALEAHPDTDIFVLSEYTFTEALPPSMGNWCRKNRRHLVVGAQDPCGSQSKGAGNYYNTAFVVGPEGGVVFKQAKSVPIQFFQDGLPAPGQEVWESPWGRIGICICYDLSYSEVVKGLVSRGAQALIVPTMDKEDWGLAQHRLHALVAPVRAAEYGVGLVRVASSGYSQWVDPRGHVVAWGGFPGQGEVVTGCLELVKR